MLASGLGSLMGMADGGRVGYQAGGPVIQPMQAGQNPVPPPMQAGRPPVSPPSLMMQPVSPDGFGQGFDTTGAQMGVPAGSPGTPELLAAAAPTAAPAAFASSPTPTGLGSLGFGSNPALGQALMAGGAAFAGGQDISEGLARAVPGALQAYRNVQLDEAAKKQRELQNRIAEQRAAQAVQEFQQRQEEFKWRQEQAQREADRQARLDPLTISKLEREAKEPGFAEQRRIATDETLRLEREKQAEREKLADRVNLTGPERERFILTGELPTTTSVARNIKESNGKFYEILPDGSMRPVLDTAQAGKDKAAQNIAGGISTLARIPQEMDAFEAAVGGWRGDPNSTILGGIARTWGSISPANWFNETNAEEVRKRIAADQEALAAVIKPLIRGPGEGAWTDADQARLVAIVGDLTTARDTEDYMRRIDAVRKRIESNFGIQLPPIGKVGSGEGKKATTFDNADSIPDGATVKDETGRRFVKRNGKLEPVN